MLLLVGYSSSTAAATMPVLAVIAGGITMKFTASELLARADAGTVAVPRDPSYGEAMAGIVGRTPARPGGYDPGACERRVRCVDPAHSDQRSGGSMDSD